MQTKTITVYDYDELSKEAKEKALSEYRETAFDTYELQVHLDNEIESLFKKHGLSMFNEGEYPKIYWSLAHCQGDGLMFEGAFTFSIGGNTYTAHVTQSGHYYHKHSKVIDWRNEDGSDADESSRDYMAFETAYHEICDALEIEGYAYIEDMESEPHFIEDCIANEWVFLKDGTRCIEAWTDIDIQTGEIVAREK